jgi:hypothetical protein
VVAFDERREYARFGRKIHIKVKSASGLLLDGLTEDLSVTGLYLKTDTPLPVGATCVVTMWVAEDDSTEPIERKGEIIRSDENGVAIEFRSLDRENVQSFLDLLGGETEDQ